MDISIGNNISNSLSGVQEQVGVSMLKGALSIQKDFSNQIVKMIKETGIGNNVDIKV